MYKDTRFLPLEEHEPVEEMDDFEGLDEFLESSQQKRGIVRHKDKYTLHIAS